MNLSKLSKEKRNHLVLVGLVTLAVLAAIGFGLIRYQYDSLKKLADRQAEAEKKRSQMSDAIRTKDQVKASLDQAAHTLSDKEVGMASGDLYSWVINTLNRFKAGYKVEIPQFSPASPEAPSSLLPKFPYRQTTITIAGTAYYHDLGKFIADFENEFPYMRILNLNLEPNPNPAAGEREKLSFRFDLVALVKSGK